MADLEAQFTVQKVAHVPDLRTLAQFRALQLGEKTLHYRRRHLHVPAAQLFDHVARVDERKVTVFLAGDRESSLSEL